jgi:hypothetical protein
MTTLKHVLSKPFPMRRRILSAMPAVLVTTTTAAAPAVVILSWMLINM